MIRTHAPSRLQRIALTVLTMSIAVAGAQAHAVELYVNTTDDDFDLDCDATHCSLREAVWSSNFYDSTPDIIYLPAGTFVLTREGSDEDDSITGDLDILDDLIIVGEGAGLTKIDAAGLGDRVFHVNAPSKNVGFALLTITGGNRDHPNNPVDGGGIYHEGGNLVLSGVTVADNEGGHGSGIRALNADVTVQDGSFIVGNTASLGGAHGGGIALESGDLILTDSTIMANRATGWGGGIHLSQSGATIAGSTLSYNSAGSTTEGGGGLHVFGGADQVNLANSTIFGNSTAGTGGAIHVCYNAAIALSGVTIVDNPADLGEAVFVEGELALVNTILSGSCELATGATVTSYGGNLESPLASCNLDPPPGQVDQVGVTDPMLSPLGHFGGGTATVLPLAGSPALDSANDAGCWPTDQRGLMRPMGAHCDTGAVERQAEDADPLFFDDFESGSTSEW